MDRPHDSGRDRSSQRRTDGWRPAFNWRWAVTLGAVSLSAVAAWAAQDPYAAFHEGIRSTCPREEIGCFLEDLREHPRHTEARHDLGVSFYRRGWLDRAIQTFEDLAASGKAKSMTYYDLACCYSLKGERNRAVSALRRAAAKGFRDWDLFDRDTDMDSIRRLPAVRAMRPSSAAKTGAAPVLPGRPRQGSPMPKEAPPVPPATGGPPDANPIEEAPVISQPPIPPGAPPPPAPPGVSKGK
ncbi:MAG: hypothetical protein HY814_04975 [Candidatus Riflebacteria bacterium]|nr:hypothetical protein [Candidatus Riflebacteria bacterium]